jgi:hypothetical protein
MGELLYTMLSFLDAPRFLENDKHLIYPSLIDVPCISYVLC